MDKKSRSTSMRTVMSVITPVFLAVIFVLLIISEKSGSVSYHDISIMNHTERPDNTRTASPAAPYETAIHSLLRRQEARAFLSAFYPASTIKDQSAVHSSPDKSTHVELSGIPVDTESAGYLLPFLKDTKITGEMALRADISRGDEKGAGTFAVRSEVSVQHLSVISKRFRLALDDREVTFSVKAVYDLIHDELRIEHLHVQLSRSGTWTLHGTLKDLLSGDPLMDLHAEGTLLLQETADIVSGPEVDKFGETDKAASGSASFDVTGTLKVPHISGFIRIQGKLFTGHNVMLRSYAAHLPFTYKNNTIVMKDGSAEAEDGGYTDVRGEEETYYTFQNVKIHMPFIEYGESGITAHPLHITADTAGIKAGETEYFRDSGISLTAAAAGDFTAHWLKFHDISLKSDLIKGAGGSVSISLERPLLLDVNLQYLEFDIEESLQKFAHLLPSQKGITARGTVTLQSGVKVIIKGNTEYHVSGDARMRIKGGGFSSSDETIIGEGVSMLVNGSYEFPIPFTGIDFNGRAEATGFELLIGRFYGNFSDRTLSCLAKGRYTAAGDLLSISGSELRLTDTGSILMSGDISGLTQSPSFDVRIDLDHLSNKEAYNFFVRDTFREQIPFLNHLDISGESSMAFALKGTTERFHASGDINTYDVDIHDKSLDRFIGGVNMHLPVDVSYPEASSRQEQPLFGSLSVKDVSWSFFRLKNLEIFPVIRENSIFFKDDVYLPLFGGSIVLRDIFYSNIFSPARTLSLAVEVNDIDLTEAGGALGMPAFSGNLSGAVPSAAFSENRFLTEGEIILHVFDGEIKVSDFSMNRVFSTIPSLKCDIKADGIDLGQLTGTFDFGHISGIVQGDVNDLVIVRGQAQSFKARLESVKKKGVSQKINVEALKKISILGSGSSTSILDRGIYRLFKEYRYEKLGFSALLKNDRLLLRGIENEGNVGYLVKGGLFPPKVDVINYTQYVSFQEMVKRLKRITQAPQ